MMRVPAEVQKLADLDLECRLSTSLNDEELVALARTDDSWAVDALMHRHQYLARAKAGTFFVPGAEGEDLVQEALIGLFKAIKDYDLEGSCPFRAFADLCIGRQLISALKASVRMKHTPLRHYISINGREATARFQSHRVHAMVAVADPAEIHASLHDLGFIQESFSRNLSELETAVLRLHLEGCSGQEIAERVGRSVKAVYNAQARIKEKTQGLLEARRELEEAV